MRKPDKNINISGYSRYKACTIFFAAMSLSTGASANTLCLTQASGIQILFYIFVAVIVIGLIVLALFTYFMKKKVAKATEKMSNQNQELNLVITASNTGIWGYNIATRHFYNIKGIKDVQERDTIEKLSKHIHPDDFPQFKKAIDDLSSGKAERRTIIIRFFNQKTKKYEYIEKLFVLKRDKDGNITDIIGTRHNMTDSLMKDREMAELLTKYRSVFNGTDVGLEYFDKDGNLSEINDQGCEILGIVNRDVDELKKFNLFKHLQFSKDVVEEISNFRHCNFSFIYDSSELEKLGIQISSKHVRHLNAHISPTFTDDGQFFGYVLSIFDITESDKLNEQNQELFAEKNLISSTLPIGMAICDANCRIVNMNQVCADLLGITDPHAFHTTFKELIQKLENIDIQTDSSTDTYTLKIDFEEARKEHWFDTSLNGKKVISVKYTAQKDIDGKVKNYIFMLTDDTAAYEHNKALEESALKTQLAMRVSHISQIEYDVATRCLSIINEKGNTRKLTEDVYTRLVHPDDFDRFLSLLDDVNAGVDKDFMQEFRVKVEGKDKWQNILSSFSPLLRNDNGRVTKYTGFQRNNTEWHRLNAQLQEKNDMNELILNNITSGLVYADKDAKVIWENVSEKFPLSITGGPLFEQGKYCYETHGEFKIPCEKCLIFETMRTGEHYQSEKKLYNGQSIEITSGPIKDKDGKTLGVILRIDDISERKRLSSKLEESRNKALNMSQLLSEILDRVPTSLFIKDADDGFRYMIANNQFCRQMNLSESQIIGKRDFDLVDKKRAALFEKTDIAALEKGVPTSFEESIRSKDGTVRYWRSTKSIITTFDGHRLLIGISLDLTEMRRINEALNQAKNKAEESDKLKSAFLANMSHEIRTPLNAITGFAQLLAEGDASTEEIKEYNQIISTNSELLLRLINDILDLSKIDAGIINLDIVKFNIADFMKDLSTQIRLKLLGHNVDLIAENPYNSCICEVDRERLSQVWSNFLTNAIKYTAKGYIKTGYRYINNGLYFYVEDTGIGIAENKHDKIFQRFEKLDNFAQGTGLGLSISKAIIEMCGGKIGFESEEGKGSKFWAWIPTTAEIDGKLTEKSSIQLPNESDIPIEVIGKMTALKGQYNFLVAEDNETNYTLIRSMLPHDCTTNRAINGIEVVNMAKSGQYDAVIMDIKMPLMDGLEATKAIRRFNEEIPIIAVTAHSFENDKRMALEAGCNEYIAKPIKREALLYVIAKALHEDSM